MVSFCAFLALSGGRIKTNTKKRKGWEQGPILKKRNIEGQGKGVASFLFYTIVCSRQHTELETDALSHPQELGISLCKKTDSSICSMTRADGRFSPEVFSMALAIEEAA